MAVFQRQQLGHTMRWAHRKTGRQEVLDNQQGPRVGARCSYERQEGEKDGMVGNRSLRPMVG